MFSIDKLGFSVSELSISLGRLLINGNLLIPIALLIVFTSVYFGLSQLLRRNFYIDEINLKKKADVFLWNSNINLFNRLGNTGHYLLIEIYLLIRNKRTRQAMLMLPIFLIYFFIISIKRTFSSTEHLPILYMISLFIGFGATLYGQSIFSWDSTYFDGILARKINFLHYLKAKYYLMVLLTLLVFFPFFIVFFIFSIYNLVLLLCILIFSLGVNCFLIMLIGTFNDGRINLNQSHFMNYQGRNSSQLILSAILMLVPIIIYTVFKRFLNSISGEIAIAVPGLFFIIFHNWWIKNVILKSFSLRKYINLEGYRKLTT